MTSDVKLMSESASPLRGAKVYLAQTQGKVTLDRIPRAVKSGKKKWGGKD